MDVVKAVLLFLAAFSATTYRESELKALYNTLEPKSAAQALAFYELYPESREGALALQRIQQLFNIKEIELARFLPRLINRVKGQEDFSEDELQLVESLASALPNRQLRGYYAQSEREVLALPSEEIDLGKALLLSQLHGQEGALQQARSYSAMLDLMALQILSQLPKNASPEEKIEATNRLIFEEMHFRFPPQSIYADEIDRFTFLPSVMDDHLGVCLGVTAIYLAIAQRIELPLEIITPPGHIYVRYRNGNRVINIETTARGIHVPSESYLSVAASTLQERTLKEVIGMTHVNQASTFLQAQKFQDAAASYEKALPYMPKDSLVLELSGYSYLLLGEKEKGEAALKALQACSPSSSSIGHKMAIDYLEGKVGIEGIQAVFKHVDETRDSILAKIKELENILNKFPEFRDGLEQMAVSWIQLNRAKEAVEFLTRYHEIDSENPVIEYYLSVLYGERYDFKNSWKHLNNAERLTAARNFYPKALKDLRRALTAVAPPPVQIGD